MRNLLRVILTAFVLLAPTLASSGADAVWLGQAEQFAPFLSSSGAPSIGPEKVSIGPMENGCAGTPCTASCTYAACAVSACSLQHAGLVDDAMPFAAAVCATVAGFDRHSDGQRLLPDKPPPRL